MALERSFAERAELRRKLSMVLLAVIVGAALVAGASLFFGWNLVPGTDFTITTDPAGALPF
ncbi:MAG: hypothetical protein EPO36_13485 [Chloroflexota bacterium]|nr:MAG: hypothetical protein EPO36_13485 [Chloroflexota bacterium]